MNQTNTPKKAVVAFSGGLDTSFCVLYLRDQGYSVCTVTVDSGGFSNEELIAIAESSKRLGAQEHQCIDARDDMYNRFAAYIIKGNILRGGVYPLCVGVERTLQAELTARYAKKVGATAICHGCTGAGNDQVRFDVALRSIDSSLKIIAPIRELQISREAEISYLTEHGIQVDSSKKKYSINQGILGVTIGGGETHNSWEVPPDQAYLWTRTLAETPKDFEDVVIGFEAGLAVSLNTSKMSGPEILQRLHELGGKHGVGRGIHLGDTIVGIKGRIAFEAPGTLILINAHRELEKLTLGKWQSIVKDMVSQFYGMRLHEGAWFEPVMRDCEALIDSSQSRVSGDVRVRLHHGNAIIQGCRSPYSLMIQEAMYGEGSKLWDGKDAEGFCKILGLPSMLANKVMEHNQ